MSRSKSPLLSEWVDLNDSSNLVVFSEVKQTYSADESITVNFQLSPGSTVQPGDTIVVVPVGLGNVSKPCCSVDVTPSKSDDENSVIFTADVLPKKNEFYQFLYLRKCLVLGASCAFYLHASADEMLSIMSEEDFLVVQPSQAEAQREFERIKSATGNSTDNSIEASLNSLKLELQQQGNAVSQTSFGDMEDKSDSIVPTSFIHVSAPQSLNKAENSKAQSQLCQNTCPPQNIVPVLHLKRKEAVTGDNKTAQRNEKDAGKILMLWGSKLSLEKQLKEQQQKISELEHIVQMEKQSSEAFREQLKRLSEEKSSLQKQLGEKDLKIRELTSAFENQKETSKSLQEDVLCLSKAKSALEIQLDAKEGKAKSFEFVLQMEKEAKEAIRKELVDISVQKNVQELELKEKSSTVDKLTLLVEEEQNKCAVLNEQVANLTYENEALRKQLEAKVPVCSSLQEEIIDKELMLSAANASKILVVEELREVTKKKEELGSENETLKNQFLEKKEQLKQLQEVNFQLLQDMEKLKLSYEQKIKSIQDEKLKLAQDLENVKFEAEERKKRLMEESERMKNVAQELHAWGFPQPSTSGGAGEGSAELKELRARLSEAATLYKQQYMEIWRLKRLLRKAQGNQQSTFEESMTSSQSSVHSEFSALTSVCGARSEASSFVIPGSDSDTGEHFPESRGVDCEAEPSFKVPFLAAEQQVSRSVDAAVMTPPPPYETSFSAQPVNSSVTAPPPAAHTAKSPQEVRVQSEQEKAQHTHAQPQESTVVTFMLCPDCNESIPIINGNDSLLTQHFLDVHSQHVCPVCGTHFDSTLPSEYFQVHVERHFD